MVLHHFLPITTVLLLVGVFAEDQLVMVNLLYRHGARSPAVTYPTDPNNNKWPDGLGRLTQKGMNLEYNLGKFLKKRYIDTKFINTSYLHEEVYIRSSGVDRCLQSAETQLAGLYPPEGWQVWNKDLKWQPIPVQTVPTDQDPLLRPGSTDCPRYKQLIDEKVAGDEYVQKQKDNQELLDYMSENAGSKITFDNFWSVSDPTIAELTEGPPMKPPLWVMKRFPEIKELAFWIFSFQYYGSAELGRLTGGALLGEMEKHMQDYVAGKKTFKLNIYSAHDSTLLSLSSALNVLIPETIPFAACALVELFKTAQGKYYIHLSYRNDTNSDFAIPFQLDGCAPACPLDDFIRLTKDRIPVDREAECQVKEKRHFFTYLHLKMIAIVLFSLIIILLVAFVWVCVRGRFKRGRPQQHFDVKKAGEDVPLIS